VVDSIGHPSHHNVWGAVMRRVVQNKSFNLIDTGKRQAMTTEKSHARQTPIYIKR
jgi:hypothetical protein